MLLLQFHLREDLLAFVAPGRELGLRIPRGLHVLEPLELLGAVGLGLGRLLVDLCGNQPVCRVHPTILH